MDPKNVTFTTSEQRLILAALLTVNPSGGGGAINSLYMRVSEVFGATADLELCAKMAATVISEAREAGVI